MYLNTCIFPTTGYARVLLFVFMRRMLGGTGTGCLFQFTYCATFFWAVVPFFYFSKKVYHMGKHISLSVCVLYGCSGHVQSLSVI